MIFQAYYFKVTQQVSKLLGIQKIYVPLAPHTFQMFHIKKSGTLTSRYICTKEL